ncbi:MAG TPA: hypothetical protein VGP93_06945 [Polyangiaceae bacterium]|nr:hypothetical protein [Polyangiaceae bacterium]
MKRTRVFVLALLALLFVASPAAAAENEYWDGGFGQKAERRSDVVLGAAGGLLLGTALAYPNEVDKLDDPKYAVDTGFGAGSEYALWLGVALKDWFVFGVGGFSAKLGGSAASASGGGLLFHVESFPLYGLGGSARDLALYAEFGAGSLTVSSKGKQDGEGGLVSIAGLGSSYELWRLGHFAFGPNVSYTHVWSQTSNTDFVEVGLRAVFYGGPG